MIVWVEGATGKAGRRVVQALTAAGATVRAASRYPGEPSPGVTPVRFDWYDESTWPSALGDADAMVIKGLDSDDDAHGVFGRLLASAPRVRHVVLLSAVGVDRAPEGAPRRAAELVVQNSGKRWTILRANWFMQNFDEDTWVFAKALREDNELYASSGEGAVAFTDTRDIAAAAVTVLTQDGYHERGYDITGPDLMTFRDVADILGKVSGRPIRYVEATRPQHREYFARSGRPDAWADHMVHLFDLVRAGVFAWVSDDFQQLTGKPPRTLEAYAKEVWAARATT
jgi:uncharacterized protein YbjT (DUF2867 family)